MVNLEPAALRFLSQECAGVFVSENYGQVVGRRARSGIAMPKREVDGALGLGDHESHGQVYAGRKGG